MPTLVTSPYPIYHDEDGQPLEDGYIYIGAVGLNPITNPQAAYWDRALTVPAAGIRTVGGYPSYQGSPGRLYVATSYSILVMDKERRLVYSSLSSDEWAVTLDSLAMHKANTIAEIRALTVNAVGYAVKVMGYYAAGDGGGGPERRWVSGAAPGTYVDNGGSVIVPTGGDGSAAWLWEWSGPVNVDWFGADSGLDAAAAFNAAFAVSDSVEGSPGKTYWIESATIAITLKRFRGHGCTIMTKGGVSPVFDTYRCQLFDFSLRHTDGAGVFKAWKDNINTDIGIDAQGYIDSMTNVEVMGFRNGVIFNGTRTIYKGCFFGYCMTALCVESMVGVGSASTTLALISCHLDYNAIGLDSVEDRLGNLLTNKLIGLTVGDQTVFQGNFFYAIRRSNMFQDVMRDTWFEDNGNNTPALVIGTYYSQHNTYAFGALLVDSYYNYPNYCRFGANLNDIIEVPMAPDWTRWKRINMDFQSGRFVMRAVLNNNVGQEDSEYALEMEAQDADAVHLINDNILVTDLAAGSVKEPVFLAKIASNADVNNRHFTNFGAVMYNYEKAALTGTPFKDLTISIVRNGVGDYTFSLAGGKFQGMVWVQARSTGGAASRIDFLHAEFNIVDSVGSTIGNQFDRINVKCYDNGGVAKDAIIYLLFLGNERTDANW